ncbi:hypothetical protein DFH09DRAFT_1362305 [Mycena vulgaris]|nr:hypothetical protein DFH09DRAFT_1362305 [Mycena vulgaris]
MTQLYLLRVCSAELLAYPNDADLYVKVHQAGCSLVLKADIKSDSKPSSSLISSDVTSAEITLKIYHKESLLVRDKCLGEHKTTIEALLRLCASEGGAASNPVPVDLENKGNMVGTLRVHLQRSEMDAVATNAVNQAENDIDALAPGENISHIADAGDAGAKLHLGTVLKRALQGLERIKAIGDVHPYTDLAWSILNVVYQAVKDQRDKDAKLVKLVETMADVCSLHAQRLAEKIQDFAQDSVKIAQQMVECAFFIRDYCGHKFPARLLRGLLSNPEDKIDARSAALLNLKQLLHERAAITTVFMLNDVREQIDDQALKAKLSLIQMNTSLRTDCLPGTRRDILGVITDWLITPHDSNVFWLYGVAGSGKSTIAFTIFESFSPLRLGAFVFFQRNSPATAQSVVHTIAYQLAMWNSNIHTGLRAALAGDPRLLNANIRTQFQKLVVGPSSAAHAKDPFEGQIIIIMDALDECSDKESHDALVELIVDEFPKLPSVFRVFITNRRDFAHTSQVSKVSHITRQPLDAATPQDITSYLEQHLRHVGGAREMTIQTLVKHSGGLFIWVATVCKFLDDCYDPETKLRKILALNYDPKSRLDTLYTIALQESGAPWDDEDFASDANKALAAVAFARIPLTGEAMDSLLHFESPGRFYSILDYLGCVIRWVPDRLTHALCAQMLHTTFGDYLTDPERCIKLSSSGHSGTQLWFVDRAEQNESLALGCLRILNSKLRFNICSLEDSHLLNSEVWGLAVRINQCLPLDLCYASEYWASHLQDASPGSKASTKLLRDFITTRLLFWLEVLSLLNLVNDAYEALQVARNYIQNDKDLDSFLHDAQRFLEGFAPVIAQSVPHIYISALPLTPTRAKVRQNFASEYPRVLCYEKPLYESWPRLQKIIQGPKAKITRLTFSNDEKQLLSVHEDGTVLIWDPATGVTFSTPLEGYGVFVAAFFPNGKQVIFGCRDHTLRIWNPETNALSDQLTGHTNSICAFAFSGHILSGSLDGTVHFWDPDTRTAVRPPLRYSTEEVVSASFSPNGKEIVFLSDNRTVCIWDLENNAARSIWESPDGCFDSVMFLPDGKQILAIPVFDMHTLQIWNSETRTVLEALVALDPDQVFSVSSDGRHVVSAHRERDGTLSDTVFTRELYGGATLGVPLKHPHQITSVTFSNRKRWISCGSSYGDIYIWDAEHGIELNESGFPLPWQSPLKEHSCSIACSPDGKRIAWGSWDGIVSIWNAETGTLLASTWKPDGPVASAAFSPDGTRIVTSGFHDVHVWDAECGHALGEPMGPITTIQFAAFASDGSKVIFGSQQVPGVHSWDMETPPFFIPLPGSARFRGFVTGALSSNGKWLASASNGFIYDQSRRWPQSLQIWDVETSARVGNPLTGHRGDAHSVSSDGRWVFSGLLDGTVRIWSVDTGTTAGELSWRDFKGPISSVAVSPDDKYVVAGSRDGTICIWDITTRKTVGALSKCNGIVDSVVFTPDGRRVVSRHSDNTIRVWEIFAESSDEATHLPEAGRFPPFQPEQQPTSDILWGEHARFEDGWVYDSFSRRILWVPAWLRDDFCLPWNSFVIGPGGTHRMDLTHFVHGKDWVKCVEPIPK